MNVKRVRSLAPIVVLVVFAALLSINVQSLTAATAATAVGGQYGMVHIANNVWHCTTGGQNGCSPESSHIWGEPPTKKLAPGAATGTVASN